MGVSNQITAIFPLGHLFYILTSGLVFILLVPYDIFSITSPNDVTLLLQNLGVNFSPFINFSYITNFEPTELTTFILVAFSIGILFQLVRESFTWINHNIKCVIKNLFKFRVVFRWSNFKQRCDNFLKEIRLCKGFGRFRFLFSSIKNLLFTIRDKAGHYRTQSPYVSTKKQIEGGIVSIRFSAWARKNEFKSYLDFLWGIVESSIGLVNGIEGSLIVLIFISLPTICVFSQEKIFGWIITTSILLIAFFVSIIVYKFQKTKHKKQLEPFHKMFFDYEKFQSTIID